MANTKAIREGLKNESIAELRKILANGMAVWDVEISRARSGMSARYKFFVPVKQHNYSVDNILKEELTIQDITRYIAHATGSPYNQDNGTVQINGCGFNRPQHLLDFVSNLIKADHIPYGKFCLRQRSL